MPRLVGDGVETLDLSSSPHVSDTALRYLAAHGGTRHSLRHISVAATSVTLLGLGPLLRDCERLSHLDVSHCRGLVADKFETVLPTRRIPDAWEDEYVAGEWRDGRALRTLVWQGIPAAVLARLEAGFPWIEVNPPDWRASPFDQAALRAELLVPACLWVRPRQAEELAREAARERARAEEEQAAGRWGPGERTAAQKMRDALDQAGQVGGTAKTEEERERAGAVYLGRWESGQPGVIRRLRSGR